MKVRNWVGKFPGSKLVIGFIAVVALGFVAAAAARSDGKVPSATPSIAVAPTKAASPKTTAQNFRVAVLFPGTENDGSWGQGWARADKSSRAYRSG